MPDRGMRSRLEAIIRGFFQPETLRYLIFGVLAVAVNTASFWVLKQFADPIAANTAAFVITVLFAYWTNSTFVFRVGHTWRGFWEFVGMRAGTIVLDDGLLWLLLRLGAGELLAKIVVNVVVIAINYLISKLIVFKKR